MSNHDDESKKPGGGDPWGMTPPQQKASLGDRMKGLFGRGKSSRVVGPVSLPSSQAASEMNEPTTVVHVGELRPALDDSGPSGAMSDAWRDSEPTRKGLTRFFKRQTIGAPPGGSATSAPIGGSIGKLGKLDYLAMADTVTRLLQARGLGFYGKLLTVLLCTFFLADVIAILAGNRIPEPPVLRAHGSLSARVKSLDDYGIIMTRNLFNRRGLIPGEEAPGGGFDPGGAPVKSTLPLNLLGIVILRDEMRSIATIEDKGANMTYPIRVDEEIPGKARIVKIEPRRVIFVNTAANRREYLELPEDGAAPHVTIGTGGGATPGIEQVASGQFNIDRKEVDKALGDLNNILTQARAVPNFENGVAAGYKLFQIVPGSIYDKLGLKNGDVIAGLDGSPVSDPGKAFEVLNSIKTRSNLELQIKRDGKTQNFSYEIH